MLFGYVKGVFIGVWEFCEGLLCSVNGGMLFFDEIGELGVDEQVMLLKVIEEKIFYLFGSDCQVSSDFQFIVGMVCDLCQLVVEGKFCEDLYVWINFWIFILLGLCQCQEDIELNLDYEVECYVLFIGDSVCFNIEVWCVWLVFVIFFQVIWCGNFCEFFVSVMWMVIFVISGCIILDVVEDEINCLCYNWQESCFFVFTVLLGVEVENIDFFDCM